MSAADITIAETVTRIREALRDYIEATYHVGDPDLVAQRRALLEAEGVLHRAPYIESTPRYRTDRSFASLDLTDAASELFAILSAPPDGQRPLVFDPPYTHQSTALEAVTRDHRSLVVSTGTGSGKTETFLLPILAKLAHEAKDRPQSFEAPAVRAILLYPMNALVNDQLGRLRLLLGSPLVASQFQAWSGRPARFARYTSRTLYPGVRTSKKDTVRLRSIERFYISLLEAATDPASPEQARATMLIKNLQSRGKWPAKPDMQAWFGRSGTRWKNRAGEFVRAVVRPDDPELLTRHEVLSNPPDILVTNYSMLEYMLMRPLERPVFDMTRAWLANNPDERFVLVVDEAHMYSGAAGAEVALLLRRLRARLDITADRLQVICTSASFNDVDYARTFAAQLSGKSADDFVTVRGELAERTGAARGAQDDVSVLAAIPLGEFYDAETDGDRLAAVSKFLAFREVASTGDCARALFDALESYPPMAELVNRTMREAMPIAEIGREIFNVADADAAERAITALVAIGSYAKPAPGEAGLLPCRIHAFFRGLPGLWACIDSCCPEKDLGVVDSPIGKLYAQPQTTCGCGARVFELYTCRNCGTAYARAYTDTLDTPEYLWNEPGGAFMAASGIVAELLPLDLLLEEPTQPAEAADLDLVTGRLNPMELGPRTRQVFMKLDRVGAANGHHDSDDDDDEDDGDAPPESGEFRPCGVCGTSAGFGKSPVQDHQTKGDQPFQALVTRQIEVQPPGAQPYSDFAPLRGRKVLAFSDSRQTAARLAPNLQDYAMRDVIRPVMLKGWQELESSEFVGPILSLSNLYVTVMVGAHLLSVRLRPELRGTETLQPMRDIARALDDGALEDPALVMQMMLGAAASPPPRSLLRAMLSAVNDRHYGLTSLGLASLRERATLRPKIIELPAIPGLAETDDEKLALTRLWLSSWMQHGVWFPSMDVSWFQTPGGVRPHSGRFSRVTKWLAHPAAVKAFNKDWLPRLLDNFCEMTAPQKYRLLAGSLALNTSNEWGYCQTCRTTQAWNGHPRCTNCRRPNVVQIDPATDAVFAARKGYYRGSSMRALADPPEAPMALIAAEHTAQLNASQSDEVFSKAETHELLFQDVNIGMGAPGEQAPVAIDVLSCTTTMEVGIDIGALSGVALRNMPPSRASYQQRAGRAGRRGNAVATVLAFGSADSHDEQYFSEPDLMIRGQVDDPVLTLNNAEIARRHVTAFLFQRYHQERLPEIDPEAQPQLFEVLGTVGSFMSDDSALNRDDFAKWLRANEPALRTDVEAWLPTELLQAERELLLDGIVTATLDAVDRALGDHEREDDPAAAGGESDEDAVVVDAPPEEGEERGASPQRSVENLLDRLLYKGVLPRYAFPTDVVAFHVFDRERSTRFRAEYKYAPSQGLPIALSQYAPGKEIWIDGKLWTSGALYSPMSDDRFHAWQDKALYFECGVCHYARTDSPGAATRGEVRDCPACGSAESFGPARNWMRPPGFAHPTTREEGTSADDQPARSYATRAKLVASGPSDETGWESVTDRLRVHYHRRPLLVTNTGPRHEGYSYCTRCGLIEPTASVNSTVFSRHPKPYPDEREPNCEGTYSTRGLVLGTDFISDVLLVSLSVDAPITLRPGNLATDVALRTLCEALSIAATRRLEIEPGEVQAEYRPALSPRGHAGLEAELYVYDTLAGGAGFSRRIGDLGVGVFEDAIALLENCPTRCDHSCYRCLRSFKNRFEHHLLDRHLGASLLRYVVLGDAPTLDGSRMTLAANRLYEDVARQGVEGLLVERDVDVEVPGVGVVRAPLLLRKEGSDVIVGIHAPLTPDHAETTGLHEAKEFGAVPVVLVDEIVTALNLPAATRQVLASVS